MPAATSRVSRSRRGKHLTTKSVSADSSNFTSYTRVSKLGATRKELGVKTSKPLAGRSTTIEIVLGAFVSKKRKTSGDAELFESATDRDSHKRTCLEKDTLTLIDIANTFPRRKAFDGASVDVFARPFEPITKTIKRKRSVIDAESPENHADAASQAEALLGRLNLQSSPVTKRAKFSAARNKFRTNSNLPPELCDLVDLHSSFLKTLALHYAHHGTTSPVDLRAICQTTTQSWGKRMVTIEDIRRCIGIVSCTSSKDDMYTGQSSLTLADYGRGKICIELSQSGAAGPLKELELKMEFASRLRSMWSMHDKPKMAWFMANLPLASIKACTANTKPPLLAKGQITLDKFKQDVARVRQEKEAKAQAVPVLNADGSKMSLLDRIRFKEIQQTQLPSGPTPAEIERRSALQRANDVAAVIGMLVAATSSGQSRVCFPMPVVLTKLRDSLRLPLSGEDGLSCIRLLAKEVAPQWIKVVAVGGRENVVVQTAFQPSKAMLHERTGALLADGGK